MTAQTAALQSQRSALDLANRQRRAGVQLIRALGGGWVQPANAPEAAASASPRR